MKAFEYESDYFAELNPITNIIEFAKVYYRDGFVINKHWSPAKVYKATEWEDDSIGDIIHLLKSKYLFHANKITEREYLELRVKEHETAAIKCREDLDLLDWADNAQSNK